MTWSPLCDYVKKFASFCRVLKEMHAKENWFFFLPIGLVWADKNNDRDRWSLHMTYNRAGNMRTRGVTREYCNVSSDPARYTPSTTGFHGRPYIAANGVGWPLPWRMNEKLKSENMQKRAVFYVYVIFWEQSGQAGVENGAILTTYLFRYTSECTIS